MKHNNLIFIIFLIIIQFKVSPIISQAIDPSKVIKKIKWEIPPSENYVFKRSRSFTSGLMEKNGRYYHILKSGKLVALPEVDSIDTAWYSKGNYKVIHKGLYNEWDPEKGMVYPEKYSSIREVYEITSRLNEGKLYSVGYGLKKGIVDEKFTELVQMEYEDVIPIAFGHKGKISKDQVYYMVKKNELWGILNFRKTLIIPCVYSSIVPHTPELYEIYHNGVRFLINDKNDLISPTDGKIGCALGYDSTYIRCRINADPIFSSFDGTLPTNFRATDSLMGLKYVKNSLWIKNDSNYYAIQNSHGEVISDYLFNSVEKLTDDLITVSQRINGKITRGIYSISLAKIVVPIQYAIIEPQDHEKDFFLLKKQYNEVELFSPSTGLLVPSVKATKYEKMGKRFMRYKNNDGNDGLFDIVLNKEIFVASKANKISKAGNYIIRTDLKKYYLYDSLFNFLNIEAVQLNIWQNFIVIANESYRYGLRTLDGKIIIHPGTYDEYWVLGCDEEYLLMRRYDNKIFAIVNKKGEFVNKNMFIKPSPDQCKTNEIFLRIQDHITEKYGYVLKNDFSICIDRVFDETYFISDNIRLVRIANQWGILDLSKNK